MASTSSLASTVATKAAAATNLRFSPSSPSNNLSFRLSPKPKLPIFTQGQLRNQVLCPRVKAQLNEVGLDGSSNAAAPNITKSEAETLDTKDPEPSSGVLATEESISQFITQVASLVKLVDSRDIVELHLKQLDIEVTIRKKEAIPQLQSPPQPSMVYSPPSPAAPPVSPASTSTHTPAPPARAPSSSSPPAIKSAKSSHPPLKSPMAGTFYRSPAPGEPAFVKVGDKVKKGQVLCIIEAMKLMNEIEADQSGTIVDILAEDGKAVSVDTPLFVIEP
ncbi:hypothetical protein RIF29_38018 [Crotalaria pallida]|uniref:Biotin carboxyl carrier protein of acetyl-CoA carboxylase n=1 Tax=Crotalaria pallida TaxID=3830 RepID=A0AAN9HP99_CROPI